MIAPGGYVTIPEIQALAHGMIPSEIDDQGLMKMTSVQEGHVVIAPGDAALFSNEFNETLRQTCKRDQNIRIVKLCTLIDAGIRSQAFVISLIDESLLHQSFAHIAEAIRPLIGQASLDMASASESLGAKMLEKGIQLYPDTDEYGTVSRVPDN